MEEKHQYCVYIMANKHHGTLYVGMTANLPKRIWEHKNKVVDSFTSNHNVDQLVYYELTSDIWAAYEREAQLKKWHRAWKIRLIEKMNPEWQDLYTEICG